MDTADGRLRELAKAEGVDCQGVLWLLDEFETGVRGELPRTRCKMLGPARYITPSSQNWSVKPFAARVVGQDHQSCWELNHRLGLSNDAMLDSMKRDRLAR